MKLIFKLGTLYSLNVWKIWMVMPTSEFDMHEVVHAMNNDMMELTGLNIYTVYTVSFTEQFIKTMHTSFRKL